MPPRPWNWYYGRLCPTDVSEFRVVPDCQSAYLDSSRKSVTENVAVGFPDTLIALPVYLLQATITVVTCDRTDQPVNYYDLNT